MVKCSEIQERASSCRTLVRFSEVVAAPGRGARRRRVVKERAREEAPRVAVPFTLGSIP